MRAAGCHVLAYLPNQKDKTKGGVILPTEVGDLQLYGRIISVGRGVTDESISEGSIAIWKRMGDQPLEFGEVEGESRIVVVMDDTIVAVVNDGFLESRGLQVPPTINEIKKLVKR